MDPFGGPEKLMDPFHYSNNVLNVETIMHRITNKPIMLKDSP